ncbi:MAG: restriction endonuclease subunit S [Desulfuromonadales bacterium]
MALGNDGYTLPDGWRWVKLGELTEIISGQSPPGETYRNAPEGLPFFQGKTDFGQRHPIPRMWCVTPVKIAKLGDILISVRAPVGPTNVADKQCCIGRGLAAIRCSESVDQEFILAALRLFENDLVKKGSGSTFQAINRDDLLNLPIPLPPLPEQKRIAAILTEKMAAVEKARVAAEARLKAVKELPAAYLLEVFESDDAQKWPRRTLDDVLIRIEAGKSFQTTERLASPDEAGVLKVSAVTWADFRPQEAKATEGSYEPSPHHRVRKGDILITRANTKELVGAVVHVALTILTGFFRTRPCAWS